MRSIVAALFATVLLAGCQLHLNEFDNEGIIQGSFSLGDRTLATGWVEMIELTGPVSDRCGPGACGLAVEALSSGAAWNPGSWRVVPPRVAGWSRPTSFVVIVKRSVVTSFHAAYHQSQVP